MLTVSLNGINKIHACTLCMTNTCSTTTSIHGPFHPHRWHQHSVHLHHAVHAVHHLPSTVENRIYTLSKVPGVIEYERLVRSWPRWGRGARSRGAPLRPFLTVRAEILWWCKSIVAAAGLEVKMINMGLVCVATCGLRLRGQLDVLLNSLKGFWRWLMVEKMNIQFNSSGGHSCSQHINCTLSETTAWKMGAKPKV